MTPLASLESSSEPAPARVARRLWLGALLAGAALLATFALVEVPRVRAGVRDELARDLVERVAIRAQAFDTWLADRRADAETVAGFPSSLELARREGSPSERRAAREHYARALNTFARTLGYADIHVLDAEGEVLAHSHDPELHAAARAVARRALTARRPHVTLLERSAGLPVLLSAAEVRAADGASLGSVVLETDPRPVLTRLLAGVEDRAWRSRATLVIDAPGGGSQLTLDGATPALVPQDPPWTAARLGDEPRFGPLRDSAGVEREAAVARLQAAPWWLVTAPDERAVAGEVRARVARSAVTWSALSVVFAMALALVLGRERAGRRSEREQVQQTLRKLSRAVEQSPVSIMITDPQGTIEYVNPKFEQVSGWTAAEVVGQTPRMLKSGQTPPEVYRALWDAVAAGREWHGELLNRKKDGALFWEAVTVAPIRSSEGAVTHVVGFKEDITARKQAEEALRATQAQLLHSQKLEAVGRLAAGIAHDFNNLLTVIDGFTRLALDELAPEAPERRRLEQVVRATERAAELTRRLLQFGRKGVTQPRIIEVGSLVRDLAGMLQRVLGEQVRLELAIDAAAGAVKADRGQLEQVLMNLAVNARDAMAGGGTLTVGVGAVGPDAGTRPVDPRAAAGRWVRLEVADTGPGMDAATLARIFEPFFTTKPAGAGTGLGLATVHGIVEQAGGFITVESEPGNGARFGVYLPRVDEPSGPPRAAPDGEGAAPRGAGEVVLVVEDEDAVRELVRTTLEQGGYRVVAARDANEALAWLERGEAVGLVLCDVIMPGMSGPDLLRHAAPRRPGLTFLFMSGYAPDPELPAPLISKPVAPAALLRAVHQRLASGP